LAPTELLDQIGLEGLDFLPELIQVLINAAMQAERSKHLKADPYERTDQRKGYANGYAVHAFGKTQNGQDPDQRHHF
jgi:transposase-like protein